MMPRNRGSQSTGLVWRRSSHSNTQGNQCVEVALCDAGSCYATRRTPTARC